MQVGNFALALSLFCGAQAFGDASSEAVDTGISVIDQANRGISGVRIQVRAGQTVVCSVETDERGHATCGRLKTGKYELTATKDGFEAAKKDNLDLSQGASTSIELMMTPVLARHESVEVQGTAPPVEQGASPPSELPIDAAKEVPGRPATVADALPLIPGVVRSPEGGLKISGSPEHRSALIVNSADVTDPATGQFGLTVPIDSVETMNVYQTPFLAEYGRFTAGLVSVETRRGGEKWKWELNDPFPDFRIRSYQMRGTFCVTSVTL